MAAISSTRAMEATATYVYCVAHAAGKPKDARVPAGLPESRPPRLLAAGPSLWIVCSTVPLSAYGPGVLDAALRDLNWVGDIAVAHESVVEHFAQQKDVTVIPMKLFTMFSNDARAAAEMQARRREILSVVKRIAGCEEWGVRIIRAAAASPPASSGQARPASGAAFLAAKKQVRDVAREVRRGAARSADTAFAALAAIARDARRRDDVPDGAAAPPLLDAAFLVPATRRTRFKAAARKLAASSAKAGTEITVTGPWPAYNFVQEPARS